MCKIQAGKKSSESSLMLFELNRVACIFRNKHTKNSFGLRSKNLTFLQENWQVRDFIEELEHTIRCPERGLGHPFKLSCSH